MEVNGLGLGGFQPGNVEADAACFLNRCIDFAKDFIVSGTASDQLFGTCESFWEPDLGPEELFETISQSLLNSVDRDALSGWGAEVYIITKDSVTKRLLKGRQD